MEILSVAMPPSTPQDMIIGAATGYSLETLHPFVASLKKSGFCGRTCLFVRDMAPAVKRALIKLGVELYDFEFGFLDRRTLMTSARFWVFHSFLAAQQRIGRVMLTDVRDVLFQGDPFNFDGSDGFSFFLENAAIPITDCPYNRAWMIEAYGQDMLARIGGEVITCVGTVLGSGESVRVYLERMIRELAHIHPDFFGSDQAAHNVLARTDPPEGSHFYPTEDGPVMTLGSIPAENILINAAGQVVNRKGVPALVLHQYDRYPKLAEFLIGKLG